MKKDWLVLGVIFILVSVAFLYSSNASFQHDVYTIKATYDNSANNYGVPIKLSLSANFTVGQRFYFNFTNGRFWGKEYDYDHGLEPANTEFSPNVALPAYKTLEFYISTPSGDAVETEDYLTGGTNSFAVVYLNQSKDFVELTDGNLTFGGNVGPEGQIQRNGTYTITVDDIEPSVMKDATHQYGITTDLATGDPPALMNLWLVTTAETKPYLVQYISVGSVLLVVGLLISVWAAMPNRKRHMPKSKKQVASNSTKQKP